MAVLDIVTVGDPVLEKRAEEVTKITKRTVKLINDMIETMYELRVRQTKWGPSVLSC